MSTDLSVSFANLVKTNNGFFKSEAQAKFLLSMCDNGVYHTSGHVHGNSFVLFYTCDKKGVTKVQKQTSGKGLVTQWERVEEGKVSVQNEKEIKRIKRLIKQTENKIASRLDAFKSGAYPNEDLFKMSNERDQASLVELNTMLAKL